MIRETALMLTDPFLIAREQAEDAWDHRFVDTVLECPKCERGWRHYEGGWGRCSKCQDGDIYTALCVRCQKDDNECECSVSDFVE